MVLPLTNWTIFGWLHLLLPTLVFYVLSEQGMYSGNRVIILGASVGLIGSLALGSIHLFVFAATLLPVGYILANSASKQETAVTTGLKGTVVLGLIWSLFLSGIVVPGDQSPYMQLVESLHMGIDEAIKYYRVSESVSVEMDMVLETTLQEMKIVVPLILPAIIGCFALTLVWFSMVVGNLLVLKRCKRQSWPLFQHWKLPDKLIWFAIATGIATFVPVESVQTVGANFVILLSLIYCFQGFSITVFFMNKWNVPIIFRSFVYVMVIFQSFGTIALLAIGIIDTWLDLRKLSSSSESQK